MEKPELLSAQESDAEELTNLAFRSKAHWPYPKQYLERCKPALKITPDYIRKWPIEILVQKSRRIGFYAICIEESKPTLDHLWIEPEFIGTGAGRILFEAAIRKAKGLGWNELRIVADPEAEGFYLRMGAKRIGEVESKYLKGLFLPVLQFEV